MKGDEIMFVVENGMNGCQIWNVEGKRGEIDY
jgi:hypothetical protein